jgi:tetratricopeptide (TPR) repeat protein
MLDHEQHILPVDLLFDDEQIGDFVKSIQIDSPYQQMLLDGVLTESVREEKVYVSFTVEGYFHFVLGEVIYNRTEGLGAEALKFIVEENKLNGVKEGVEQCLIRDVEHDDLTRLMSLIDQMNFSQYDKGLLLIPIKIAFNIFGIEYVLGKLLEEQSENDWTIIELIFVSSYFSNDFYNKIGLFIITIEIFDNSIAQKVFGRAILHLQSQAEQFKLISKYKKYIVYKDGVIASYDDLDKLSILAQIYENSRMFNSWLSCIDDCLKYELINYGARSKFIANSYNQKGLIYLLDELNRDVSEAINYFSMSKEINCNLFSSESIEVATVDHNLGLAYLYNRSFNESEYFLLESLNKRIKFYGYTSIHYAVSLALIGVLYKEKGDYFKSEKAFKDSLKIFLKLNPKDFWSIGNTQSNLGDLYFEIKSHSDALRCYFLSLENLKKFYDNFHVDLVRVNMKIGNVYVVLDDDDKAFFFYLEAWDIGNKLFQDNISRPFDDVADFIAGYYEDKGDFEKAISYYEKSLAIRLKDHGDKHPDAGISFSNLGEVCLHKEDYDKAISYFEKSIAIGIQDQGDLHPSIGIFYNKLGFALAQKGEYERAVAYYEKSLRIDLEIQSCPKLNQYYSIGDCLQKAKKYEDAISKYEKGFILQRAGGYPYRIAECYLAIGDKTEALNYFIQSAEIRKEQIGIEDENTLAAILKSKVLAFEIGQYDSLPQWIKEFKDDL